MKSLQGHLLIASPDLPEPFYQSVLLVIRHNEEGALGLTLNRRTTATVKQVWEKLDSDAPCQTDAHLRLGGPCDGPLMALHAEEFLLEIEVFPGIYFTAGKQHMETLVAKGDDDARFFVGYSGWSAGQLEAELKRGSWLTTPATKEHVFGDDDEMWKNVRTAVFDGKLIRALKIKHVPDNPRLN